MFNYLPAQIQQVRNNMMMQLYQRQLQSMDFRAQLSYGTQYACCDAYHLRNQPDSIRCCVLGQRYGF